MACVLHIDQVHGELAAHGTCVIVRDIRWHESVEDAAYHDNTRAGRRQRGRRGVSVNIWAACRRCAHKALDDAWSANRLDERREGLQIADAGEGDDFAGNERLGDAQGAFDRSRSRPAAQSARWPPAEWPTSTVRDRSIR